MINGHVSSFMKRHFRHFNSTALLDAAEAYRKHLEQDGYMFLTLAGAMSTAEIGLSLAEMIREEKVHAICCTGANLEEDVFNLIAHNSYVRVCQYRYLSAHEELELLERGLNRVTDTCIPEEAIKRIEAYINKEWLRSERQGERLFPHEFFYRLIRSGCLGSEFQIDPRDSWLVAACEKDLPIFVPGWEDCTIGNIYAAHCLRGTLKNVHTVRTGMEYMLELMRWYPKSCQKHPIGLFQIGGGIAGDFPISVVPLLRQELDMKDVPLWAYFCKVSDSITSYGSYSGAVPNEKISWEKVGVETPKFIIESDATIVVPLIFAYVLEA